jgi:chromosome segregation ATPase
MLTEQNACKAKLDLARPNNKDSPNGKRQQELKTELNAIRQAQQGNKSSRSAIHEQIKKYDEQLKSRLNELKTNKGKVNYKSVEDVDQEIARLQKQVDGGMMKLVDEKKALSDISNLNKARKQFSGFDGQQKDIDAIKAKIAEQKKLLDDPEQKALSEKYTALQTELDGLKAEQDEAFKNLKALREETDKARAEQQAKYQARKELKDTYYQQKRAFQEYEFQARKVRNEKRRQEQLQYVAGKRKEAASKRLEEASGPAYQDEIFATEGLIRHFDPSALPPKETTAASKFAASTQRTVDDAAFKGTRVGKKEADEESYFVGTGGKKGKKGKKAAPAESKFNLNIGIIEELAKVGLDAPSSQADVPATVEKLKEKLAFWKGDQDRKTKEVRLRNHHMLDDG